MLFITRRSRESLMIGDDIEVFVVSVRGDTVRIGIEAPGSTGIFGKVVSGMEAVNKIAADYNAAQPDYKIVPVYKGSYPETMTAAIAAFRAGDAPGIVQMFEVGTATMMAAKGAVKPVYELMKESGLPFDPNAFVPAVKGLILAKVMLAKANVSVYVDPQITVTSGPQITRSYLQFGAAYTNETAVGVIMSRVFSGF